VSQKKEKEGEDRKETPCVFLFRINYDVYCLGRLLDILIFRKIMLYFITIFGLFYMRN